VNEIEARRDGVVYCIYVDESVLPDKDTMKSMKKAGYKFYQNGKLYKPEKK
jgi:hypothetical protein